MQLRGRLASTRRPVPAAERQLLVAANPRAASLHPCACTAQCSDPNAGVIVHRCIARVRAGALASHDVHLLCAARPLPPTLQRSRRRLAQSRDLPAIRSSPVSEADAAAPCREAGCVSSAPAGRGGVAWLLRWRCQGTLSLRKTARLAPLDQVRSSARIAATLRRRSSSARGRRQDGIRWVMRRREVVVSPERARTRTRTTDVTSGWRGRRSHLALFACCLGPRIHTHTACCESQEHLRRPQVPFSHPSPLQMQVTHCIATLASHVEQPHLSATTAL